MLELYTTPESTCSQKVRLALAEKQLPYTARHVALDRGEQLSEWYLAINPNGVVPTLRHDDEIIVDSSVITEYLEDVFTDRRLRPAQPAACAKMRAWRAYIDEIPTPAIRPPSYNAFLVQAFAAMTPEQFEETAAKRPLRSHFYRQMGQTGFSQSVIDAALADLRQTLLRMEEALGHGEWVCGDMFTLADISLTPTVVRMEDLGLASMWSALPAVADWYRRIQARPSFAQAYGEGARDIHRKRPPAC